MSVSLVSHLNLSSRVLTIQQACEYYNWRRGWDQSLQRGSTSTGRDRLQKNLLPISLQSFVGWHCTASMVHINFGRCPTRPVREWFGSEAMHRRLLGEDTLTLKKVVEIAVGMEAAAKTAQAFKTSQNTVAKVDSDIRSCQHCGS